MPELPEVENLRRSLEPGLVGRRVREVEVRSPALREPLDRRSLEELRGAAVERLRRRAKYLWIETDLDRVLVVHLGMSGRLTLSNTREAPILHEHLRFHLDDGSLLRYVDPRRFGIVKVLARTELRGHRLFADLGVEPLEVADLGDHLRREARGRRGPVKTFVMNSAVVVGVGNIYAAEALWRARVHPRRSVRRISGATWTRLGEAIRGILAESIDSGGTTLRDYADAEGRPGRYGGRLAVYGRVGEDCPRCGRTIRGFRQSGRSTSYCPGCQR